MVTLYHYSIYRGDPCGTSVADLFAPIYVFGFVVCLLADVLMLGVGYVYEFPDSETATSIAERLDALFGGVPRSGLILGFVFLVFTFLPSIVVVAGHGDTEAVLVLAATLILWSTYGLTAVFLQQKPFLRSSITSVTDIVAKNVFGISLAVFVLLSDGC